jgi:hypothetical protein
LLKDQKLIVQAHLPFKAISEGVEKTKAEFGSFELPENFMDKPNSELENKVSTIWSGIGESNPCLQLGKLS